METRMSLDHLSCDERVTSDRVRLPPTGATHAMPGPELDTAAVHWLTVSDHASRAFALMTDVMRAAVLGPEANQPTPDQAPSIWLERGAAALHQVDPSLVQS